MTRGAEHVVETKARELARFVMLSQWDRLQLELAQVLNAGDAEVIVRAFQLVTLPRGER